MPIAPAIAWVSGFLRTICRIRKNALVETAATTAATVNPNVYQSAATFYLEIDHDYNKALLYADKAVAANAKAYWLQLMKAKVHVALKDKKGAKAAAEACKQLATEAKNMDYVRSADEILKSL